MLDATPNQLAFISNLLDLLPEDSEERLEYAEIVADYDRPPSRQWAYQVIDELKVKTSAARQVGGQQAATDRGILAARPELKETPAERVKRIYRGHWRLRDLSIEGFEKVWTERGAEILAFHGIAAY